MDDHEWMDVVMTELTTETLEAVETALVDTVNAPPPSLCWLPGVATYDHEIHEERDEPESSGEEQLSNAFQVCATIELLVALYRSSLTEDSSNGSCLRGNLIQ